ncbi:MAG: hypothetical protein O3B41_08340 [Bacteroidetes bacterium]|nr:hypothetical protein [Bacteroidota bacterium]
MSVRGRAKQEKMARRNQELEKSNPSDPLNAFDPPPEVAGAIVSTQYSGPIPPASMMAEFHSIDSSIPADIMEMAKAEQKHIHEERTHINKTVSKAILRPQIFAFVLLIMLITGGFWLVNQGKDVQGFILLGPAAIIALIQILRYTPKNKE